MDAEPTLIPDVKIIHVSKFEDDRGFFMETYNRAEFHRLGIDTEFVQDAQSFSLQKHTLRGLHFQRPPHGQAKLVRVEAGRLFDVAVDIRPRSDYFGQHVALTLEAGDGRMLFIPEGFAHGFCTMEPNTKIAYKLSSDYSPENADGISWNDPDLGINWPIDEEEAFALERDFDFPTLANLTPIN